MIKFELIDPSNPAPPKPDVMMYFPGQKYVTLNGLQIKLDRVLDANENWLGCVLGSNQLIHFIEKRDGVSSSKHMAKIVTTTTSEMALRRREEEGDTAGWSSEKEKKLTTMRLTQALVLLKSIKRVSGAMEEFVCLMGAFDDDMEREFPDDDSVKLGINDFILKHKGAVSLRAIKHTLKLIEEETIEIMHEEMDIPSSFKRSRRY